MFSPQLKRNIIQAIDHLRNRKARPDLHRICNMLKRRHHFSFSDSARCIEYLLNMGVVIKVEYKGSISYRDASKWKKGHVAGQIINSDVLVAKLQAAIDAVIAEQQAPPADGEERDGRGQTPDENGAGEPCATIQQIEDWFTKQPGDAGCRLTGDALMEVLTRELETESLVRVSRVHAQSGYAVGRRVHPSPPPRSESHPSPAKSPSKKEAKLQMPASLTQETREIPVDPDDETRRGRPPSKRKRIKKNHGDDFEVLPIRKSRKLTPSECSYDAAAETGNKERLVEEPSPEEFEFVARFRKCCEEHLMETPSRHEGQEHELLTCTACHMKAHPWCINFTAELLENIDRSTWCCASCKHCSICNTLLRTATPVTCSSCDKAYHRACHKPILRKRPKGNWKCMACQSYPAEEDTAETAKVNENSQDSIPPVIKTENETSFPPTPCDSPSPDNGIKISPEMPVLEPMDERQARREDRRSAVSRFDGQSFPDVTQWSVEKISEFVSTAGFPDQAEALKEEEIDGEALMDLKRVDVLTRFSFKLGPALKLYRLILNMQTNGNASDFI